VADRLTMFVAAVMMAFSCAGRCSNASESRRKAEGSISHSAYCEWGAFNEGSMTVGLDDPGVPRTCLDTPCDGTVIVDDHGIATPGQSTDIWFPYLQGRTAQGDRARLGFLGPRGWDVTWKPHEVLHVRRVIRMEPCPGNSSSGGPSTESATEIRDAAGKLLLLNAPDIPLAQGGRALLAPGFGPELRMSWTDLSCPAYQGPGVGPAGGGRRTVGVVVTDARDAEAKTVVTWGRNGELRLNGEPYVVAVSQGWVFANGVGCGRAALTIYRAGYLRHL
jgi:hypothetical protein